MHIHTKLILFAFLSALPLSNSFGSAPAQPASPSLEEQLAVIDAMPDEDILCTPAANLNENVAKKIFEKYKTKLRTIHLNNPELQQLAMADLVTDRVMQKVHLLHQKLSSCNDPIHKQQLKNQYDAYYSERLKTLDEANKIFQSCRISDRTPKFIITYQIDRARAMSAKGSIWQAQKEKLEREKKQWQQEKQVLLAQNKNLQDFIDGRQVEGLPNVPGGVKQKKERRGSI